MCHKISENAPKYSENILPNLLTCRHFSLALCLSKNDDKKSKNFSSPYQWCISFKQTIRPKFKRRFAKSTLVIPCPKAGHTGALDPLATGLLPVCLGEATKFSHYLLDSTKRYQTTVRLGQTTTTGDVEGDILQERPVPVLTEELIEQTLEKFRGDIQQVPPMYSALKKEGRPLYELARKGIEIEREARPVMIYALELVEFTENSITLDVTCSKGTYIRVLGEDIGEALGCGGHLTMLNRTQTGHFELIPSYTIEYLESLNEEQREALLLPVYASVDHFLKIQVPEGREKYFATV